MPLGTEVGLGPGDIVLDGDPLPQKRHSTPQFLAHAYCGQTAGLITMPLSLCYGGRPRPRPHCVRWEPSSPLENWRGTAPNFWLISVVALNG